MYDTSSDRTVAYICVLVAMGLICGFLSMSLAKKKGHPVGSWFACGLFLGIFGLIAAAGLPNYTVLGESEKPKKCPDCAEMVRRDAHVCRYCGHKFLVLPPA